MGPRTAATLVALALTLALTVAPADARTNNRTKPVVYVHGYSGDKSSNCEGTWRDMFRKFRQWGWTNTFQPVLYYSGDTACSSGDNVSYHWFNHHGSHSRHYGGGGHEGNGHTDDAAINHLAYHFAWYVRDHFSQNGTAIDVAAHSMGGLIVRYAISRVQHGDPDFPSRLLIEDVVTMGTPHTGTHWGYLCFANQQCSDMNPNSGFMTYLRNYAQNPQAYGGTDWSLMGAGDDDLVTDGSAVGMTTYHATKYLSGQAIEHSDYMHRGRDISDAQVDMWYQYDGRWRRNNAYFWPLRLADWALMDGQT